MSNNRIDVGAVQVTQVDLTPALKAKITRVTDVFLDACGKEGLKPVEVMAAVAFVQSVYQEVLGGPYKGSMIFGPEDGSKGS